MKGRVGGRKIPYQVFISLLDEASTRGPAFEKIHEKKNSREENQEKRQWKLGRYRQQESLSMNVNMNKHFLKMYN